MTSAADKDQRFSRYRRFFLPSHSSDGTSDGHLPLSQPAHQPPSGQALTFDTNGNLTSDGQRSYSSDAENRLIGITYPGVSGKATAFTYDGLGRRVSIASTPSGGGSAVTTSYLWCGSDICQARNASGTPIRGYYDEGEYVPGSPGQPYYYGIDQIGSVRRAFASTTNAPA